MNKLVLYLKRARFADSAKAIQYVGIAATIIGALISNWVADKKMEEIIEEKVNEALDKRKKGE